MAEPNRSSAGWRSLRDLLVAMSTTSRGIGVFAFLFFLFFAHSSVQFNNKVPLDDWKSHLRADAAGYYIYLPGFFHHGMRAATVSDTLIEKASHGFELDRDRDRIRTKYTCGPALLQLPFFLVAEAIEGFGATDGWTRTHHQAIEVAGIFYWTAGLLLIALALRRWRPTTNGIALFVMACVAFGTNTFYYAFRSSGYSHVYSFFLVAMALYAALGDHGGPMRPVKRRVFLAACAMIVLVRPSDVLAMLALLALLFLERPALFRSPRFYVEGAVLTLLVLLPQLAYWKFVHGSWVTYSYGEESFSNWADPKWTEVLMSPLNGLLPHAPVFFLFPFALVVVFMQERIKALLLFLLFLLMIYSCAAWHSWHFGCGYGMRPMVQFVPFLAMGLWALFDRMRGRWPTLLHGTVPLIGLLCFVNYRAMLQYGCCYVWGEWDWLPYGRNLLEAFFGKVTFP